jgi:hypothetical protein
LDGSLTGSLDNVVVSVDNITLNHPKCESSENFKNGMVCSKTNGWIRFSFNNMIPESVALINVTLNNYMATIPRLMKRLTHPFGNFLYYFINYCFNLLYFFY